MSDAVTPPTEVPDDAETVACPYCGRPFGSEAKRDLHVGEIHASEMSEAEREAYEAAVEDEADEMWLYHFKVVVILLVLYMATGLFYLVALG